MMTELGTAELRSLFDGEEVVARNTYPSTYARPDNIESQIERVRSLFPGIGKADTSAADQPLPDGAEGYFAIPRWEAIAGNYCDAVDKVMDLFKSARDGKFFNYRRGRLSPDVLQQHPRTVSAIKAIEAKQPGCDILVIPAQFGIRHAGRSIRRARVLFSDNEFGLGAFHVGVMLIVHPGRLTKYSDLWPDNPGDEYNDVGHEEYYGRATRFIFDGGQEEFGTAWNKYAEYSDGSVTGFWY